MAVPTNLPRSEFGLLPRSPLELVVCQVRHDQRALDASTALEIQEALNKETGFFPRIEPIEVHTAAIAIGPGTINPGSQEVARGWHLKSADGGWTAAVLSDQFSLETTRYTTWDEFIGFFEHLVEAVEIASPPTMEVRLGLRYVDRLSNLGAEHPNEWHKWINSTILGAPLHDVLGAGIVSIRQQIDLDLGDGRLCVLRHGTLADPATSGQGSVYLLDFDIYRQDACRFSGHEILRKAKEFHEQADSLFMQVITPELFAYLSTDNNV